MRMTPEQLKAVREFVEAVLSDPASGFTPLTLYGRRGVLSWVSHNGRPVKDRLEKNFREQFLGKTPKGAVITPKE